MSEDQSALERYFKAIARNRTAMEENGDATEVRHKDLHAGLIFLLELVEEADEKADIARAKSASNERKLEKISNRTARRIKVMGAILIVLLIINIEQIPELINKLAAFFL